MNIQEESLSAHKSWKGKLEITSRAPVTDKHELSVAYSPGVAAPCLAIQKDVNLSYDYTRRANMIAVVTDGTAVLGLGDIGPEAAMPVMEGKCILFKTFGGVDAVPLCIKSKDVDTIVNTVKLLEGSFGGINLEDISAPRCFEIEQRLKAECNIPIFHDDQHGTAIVCLAGMLNALKFAKKEISKVHVIVNGAGAAGISVTKLLMKLGLEHVILCDTRGAIYSGRDNLNQQKEEMAQISNLERKKGLLADVIVGADIFIGLSAAGMLTQDMVRSMAPKPIIFAMANPTPEIMPELAFAAGALVVGTGRSDFPNQVNNVLAFPGIFRGALDVRASDINEDMKIAASFAIASLISEKELRADYVIPQPFDPRVSKAVAKAVSEAAKKSGVARI